MNAPKGRIKIIVTPPGEAPYEVRNAWVGLILPLSTSVKDNPRRIRSWGVLTEQKGLVEVLKRVLFRRNQLSYGYVVDVDDAVHILDATNSEAAAWWRTNTPYLIGKQRKFVFDADYCEPQ